MLPNHTDYFEKFMMNMLHRKIRVFDGFGVSKVVTSTQDKKEDKEHGKPPKKMIRKYKNYSPSNWALVSQQAVSNRLLEMGKIQKNT